MKNQLKQFRLIVLKAKFPLGSFFILLTLCSGIYRHDVEIEQYLSLANEEQFDNVGQVLTLRDNAWISGGTFVVIDSVTILSAAHVFCGNIKKDTVVVVNGQKFQTYISKGIYEKKENEFQFLLLNVFRKAKRIVIHPNYLIDRSCDIAIIRLEKPIRGLPQTPLYTMKDELGDTVTGVGFGASGPANQPSLVKLYNLKLAGKNIIDSIGGPSIDGVSSILYADFDAPDKREGCNKMGSATPLNLEYCTTGGDSGGPLFIYKNGTRYLAGITSGAAVSVQNLMKNGYYCNVSAWTRVSAFSNWLQKNR